MVTWWVSDDWMSFPEQGTLAGINAVQPAWDEKPARAPYIFCCQFAIFDLVGWFN
jgi:hypothetical protein